MLGSIFEIFLNSLKWVFEVSAALCGWLFNNLWAALIALCSAWFAVLGWFWGVVLDWVFDTVGMPELGDGWGAVSRGLNQVFARMLPVQGGAFSELGEVVFRLLSFGGFLQGFCLVFLPVMVGIFTYRLVKSWIPTVAGT